MSKPIQISIPNPCHEDWNKMTSFAEGKHCNSCKKTVIDFTGFTDAQLHTFFSSPKCRNVCGRFYDDQLSRRIAAPVKPHNKVYQLLIQLSASFLLFPSPESSAKANPPTYTASDTTKQSNKAVEKEIAAVEAERREIKDIKVERTISLGGASSEGTVYIIDGFAYDKDGNKIKLHRRSLARRILAWLSR